MKIKVVFNFSREQRLRIADYYGLEGPADYKTCKEFIESMVTSDIGVSEPLEAGDD